MRYPLAVVWVAAASACAGGSAPAFNPSVGVADPRSMTDDAQPALGAKVFSEPRMKEPGCVQRSVHLSAALAPLVRPQLMVAKFAVGRSGKVSRFALTTPETSESVQRAIFRAVEDAVRACEWIPASDPDGHAVAVWVVLPIRFAEPPKPSDSPQRGGR